MDKIAKITSLLPTLEDPHAEFCLLRSCLSLPKILFTLRTVNTLNHPEFLANFDHLTREALIKTLGAPIPDMQWAQSKLPVGMGGLGLRSALDHAGPAFASSLLSSRPLVQQLLGKPDEEPPKPLPRDFLDTLSVKVGDEVTEDDLHGLTQRMISVKVDLQNQQLFSDQVHGVGEREVARVASLSLPYAGAWLTCAPIPALGLHMRGPEFVTALKFRLGLNVYDMAGKCPSCGKDSDQLGDHGMVCGTGGERISRHNALRDALYDTAASAGLAPLKEERALLPGNNRRPADILIRHWCGGQDAALDVTVTHPMKDDTRAGAAATPGHAASVTFANKMRGADELCRAEGLKFVPIVAESLGGFHPVAVEQLKKIASALARHTAQEESEAIHHLFSRCSLLLQRGTAALLLNRVPSHPGAPESGIE